MQILIYVQSEYSGRTVSQFEHILEWSEYGFRTPEVTIIFDEFNSNQRKSPLLITIAKSINSELTVSRQRLTDFSSMRSGKHVFQEFYNSMVPDVVAVDQKSLLLDQSFGEAMPRIQKESKNYTFVQHLNHTFRNQFSFYACEFLENKSSPFHTNADRQTLAM